MATTTLTPEARGGPPRARWTRAEFRRMAEAGLLTNRRVELLYGEVVSVTPMGRPHIKALNRVRDALQARLPGRGDLYQQVPLAELVSGLRDDSDPYPDAIVGAGAEPDEPLDGPVDVLLIVEIAASSLTYDLGDKRAFYADAGVPTYWVVDVEHRRLHVFSDPRDGAYAAEHQFDAADVVTLPWPAESVPVTELLPPLQQ